MMKQTLLLLLCCLCLWANAQEVSYRPVLIHYNADYKVTKPELGVYKRVTYLPDSIRNVVQPESPRFNGPVRDYYANGVLWAQGNYNQGRAWGGWSFYYPNGSLDCRGSFEGVKPAGKWEFWWPDGKPLMVTEFVGSEMRLLSFWNEQGEQTVVDGNGIYTAITTDGQGNRLKMEGAYKDGYQSGRWTYGPIDGEVLAEENFEAAGRLLSGISYEGKKRTTYTFGSRLKVQPEPNHLVAMDFWSRDTRVYAIDYPVLADVIGCGVQKVPYSSKNKAVKDHYYKIIQKFEHGTDTLDYGIPLEPAIFKGSLQTYLSRNMRFPASLAGQNLEGLMVTQFRITATGEVEKPSILKSLHPLLDLEVLRMVNSMPTWKPAMQNGKPVSMLYTLPIRIRNGRMQMQQEEYFGRPSNLQYNSEVTPAGFNRRAVW